LRYVLFAARSAAIEYGLIEEYQEEVFKPIAQRIVELAPAASAPKMQKKAS
jgi:hypothetical protein